MSEAAIHETKPSGHATGPRTAEGKRRTRYNALKRGLFFNGVLAQGESRAEFDSLLKGLIVDFQPEGVAERLEVERLALLSWRQRRFLQAETAEIAHVAELSPLDSLCAQQREKIEVKQAGDLLEKVVELFTAGMTGSGFAVDAPSGGIECRVQRERSVWVLLKSMTFGRPSESGRTGSRRSKA